MLSSSWKFNSIEELKSFSFPDWVSDPTLVLIFHSQLFDPINILNCGLSWIQKTPDCIAPYLGKGIQITAFKFESTAIQVLKLRESNSIENSLAHENLKSVLAINPTPLLSNTNWLSTLKSPHLWGGFTGIPHEINPGYVVGFYGDKFNIQSAQTQGWQTFGIERNITSFSGNVIYEIDSKPALSLYESYLGQDFQKLKNPMSYFPLLITEFGYVKKIRAPISYNAKDKSLQFLEDIHDGTKVQLMRSSATRLIEQSSLLKIELLKVANDQPEIYHYFATITQAQNQILGPLEALAYKLWNHHIFNPKITMIPTVYEFAVLDTENSAVPIFDHSYTVHAFKEAS